MSKTNVKNLSGRMIEVNGTEISPNKWGVVKDAENNKTLKKWYEEKKVDMKSMDEGDVDGDADGGDDGKKSLDAKSKSAKKSK